MDDNNNNLFVEAAKMTDRYRPWLAYRICAALISVFAVTHAAGAANVKKETAEQFLTWVAEETRRQPGLPGNFFGRVPQDTLCSKVKESGLQDDPGGEREAAVREPIEQEAVVADPRLAGWSWMAPEFLFGVISKACEDGDFLVYDPSPQIDPAQNSAPDQPPSDQQQEKSEQPAEIEKQSGVGAAELRQGFPACPDGPRMMIRPRHVWPLLQAIRSFEKLDRLSFACVAIYSLTHELSGLFDLTGDVSTVEIIDSHIDLFDWRNGKIGRLRLIGTVDPKRPASAANNAPQTSPGAEPAPPYPGTQLRSFSLDHAEIKNIEVRGAGARSFLVGKMAIDEASIVNSEFGSFILTGSKLKSFEIFQSRIGAERGEKGFIRSGDGFHFTENEVAGEVRIGPRSLLYDSLMQLAPWRIEAQFGFRPPWIDDNDMSLRVRGYMTLAQSRIGRGLWFHGLDLANDPAQDEAAQNAFLNMNRLEAGSLSISGSTIVLAQGKSVHGTDMAISGDISIDNNFIHRQLSGFRGDYIPNRKRRDWRKETLGFDATSTLFGFSRLKVRDLILRQNLIDDVTGFINVSAEHVLITTAPPHSDDRPLRGAQFCFSAVQRGSGDLIENSRLQGGLVVGWPRPWPVSEAAFPTCYGSIVFQGGEIKTVSVGALASDVVAINTKVDRGIALAGRLSGLVNFSNIQMKDNVLGLGATGAPLRWCEDSKLLLDGASLSALQADRDSLVRHACRTTTDALADEAEIGVLPMSIRGAQIARHMGAIWSDLARVPDPGILGFTVEELKEIAAPKKPAEPLSRRVRAVLPAFLGGQTIAPSATDRPLDPQALAQLAKLLKDNGYSSKSADLTIERISRQKWESGDSLDRFKWMLGWPIGWGYQVEWGFGYAIVFIFIGAWVSTYYRRYPARRSLSPPPPPWPLPELRRPTAQAARAEQRAFYLKAGSIGACLLAAMVWVRGPLDLTPDETLVLAGGLAALVVVFQVLLNGKLRTHAGRKKIQRFISVLPSVFNYHSWFFSLDRLLPAPGLHLYWGNYPRIGQTGRNYFYFHRLVGLVLASIIAAGFAGLFD
ncbi:hypothetical protein [uncultured Bradyrhizobium sp.]|uniref:hypothetical protein n=1 Tax=uncultured Bradyrhizobium sp. TaxID=199684 RepID=UPI0035CA30EB